MFSLSILTKYQQSDFVFDVYMYFAQTVLSGHLAIPQGWPTWQGRESLVTSNALLSFCH